MIRFLCWSNVWIALLIKFLQLFLTFTLSYNSHISRASKSVLSPHGKFSECTKHGAQVIRAWIGCPGCPCLCPVVEISLLIKYLLGSGDTVYPSTATTCCLRPLNRLKGTNALFWFNKQALLHSHPSYIHPFSTNVLLENWLRCQLHYLPQNVFGLFNFCSNDNFREPKLLRNPGDCKPA